MAGLLEDAEDRAIPVNMRMYLAHLTGDKTPLTEKNLWPSDLEAVKRAVARQMAKQPDAGVIGYGDYAPAPDQFSSFADGPGILGIIGDSFSDPSFRLETTLGMARYQKDPSGNVVVRDRYNFNATRKQVQDALDGRSKLGVLADALSKAGLPGLLNAIGNIYGATDDEGGTPVEINLGKVRPGLLD
jgi:hypothetical protein